MNNRISRTGLAALALTAPLCALGADTDLFVGAPPVETEVPNVLLVVDNTANWNNAFTDEMAALASTLAGLDESKFRVGIMMFTETGGGNSGNDGAYVRAAIRLMDAATKTKYQALINSFDKRDDKSNGGKAALAMAEAWRYFSAGAPHAGNNKQKTDYSGNASGTGQDQAVYALRGNALASKGATAYADPVSDVCQKNYIIYISNGPAQDNKNDLSTAAAMLRDAGGSTSTIAISPSGSQDNLADEWARWMNQSNESIVTYTLDVNPVRTGQGPGWSALLKSMAGVGGGKYFAVSQSTGGASAISIALSKVFSEIQAVNSVFAAVSLPVSVNTQGTYLNQVYVGMFRPDGNSYPRWAGNLKQYKMGYENGVFKLLDAANAGAINAQTGFITECARSFWTPDSPDTYWTFHPQGGCIPPAGTEKTVYQNSNYPDGNVVEKGAQGYVLRSADPSARNVKTCSPVFASCTSLTGFNTANSAITASALGAADATERAALINWARGQDLDDENLNGNTAESRPSIHGDVVHSRPVAINYGSNAAPQVVVYYGDNAGMLRAVNGNRSGDIGDVPPGGELWSFVAPESYAVFKRLRANAVPVETPTIAGSPKPYAFDGTMTAFKDAARTWLFATMRRGGRAMYAFDVTDPAAPALKWKIGCPNLGNDTGCRAGFENIGQTWAAPRSLFAAYYGASDPLLIMGGGYDDCEDADPNTCTAGSKGNRIYVLNANTGTLLHTFTTERGVVGDIIVANDSAGYARYAWAADLGGNVYRIDIGSGAASSWSMTHLASLGCATTADCTDNRKFIYGPDAVEKDGIYYLTLGSGDREKPLASYASAASVSNYFFMLTDKPSDSEWLTPETVNCGTARICLASLVPIAKNGATPSASTLAAKKGWYLALAPTEQVVTSAITMFGTVTFSTHKPVVARPGACSSTLGETEAYNISYQNAAPADGISRSYVVSGGGLPPSPVAGRVTLDDGRTVPFLFGGNPASPLEASEGNPGPTSPVKQPKNRVYWYIRP